MVVSSARSLIKVAADIRPKLSRGGGPLGRRSIIAVAAAGVLALTVQAVPASAAVAFNSAWGSGVNPTESNICTSSTSCQSGAQASGPGQFAEPQGVAVDSSGNVYVADSDATGSVFGAPDNDRIDKFSPTGTFLEAWGWGVSDGKSQLETCTTSCQAGIAGGGAGQLDDPQALAVDSSGDVYVADSGNNRIDEFSSTGGFIEAWGWGVSDGNSQLETCTTSCQAGITAGGAGALATPEGIAVDGSGNVFVGDYYNQRIDEFSSTGSFIQAWGWGVSDGTSQFETCTTSCQSGIAGGGAGQLDYPTGVAAADSEDVYVADAVSNRIDEFSSNGSFVQAWGWGVSDGTSQFETCTTSCMSGIAGSGAGQLDDPQGVAVASTGSVYVADTFNNRMDEFSSSGGFIEAWGWGVSDGASQFETCTASCRTGVAGGGPGQLEYPAGVATPPGTASASATPARRDISSGPGDVYVADTDNSRIDVFSSGPTFLEAWGSGVAPGAETCSVNCQSGNPASGAGEFSAPSALALDGSGDVYVVDSLNNRVEEFSSSGTFMEAWGWGVSDGTSQPETCTTTCQAGIEGGGAGQLDDPQGIAVDSSGDVYVGDTGNNRIDEFSSSGSFIEAWGWGVSDGTSQFEICTTSCQAGATAEQAGGLNEPEGVAIDSSGNVYVADTDNERIDEFSSTGSFVEAWGWGVSDGSDYFETCTTSCHYGYSGGNPGEFNGPQGVAVDASGNVYVADTGNNRIQQFSSGASFLQAWGWGVSDGAAKLEICTSTCQGGIAGGGAGQLNDPQGVGVDSSGNVYVADTNNNRIDQFSSTGSFIQAWGWGVSDGADNFETCASQCQAGIPGGGAGQLDVPGGVTADSPTQVYAADLGNNRVDSFVNSGTTPQLVERIRVRRSGHTLVVRWRADGNAGLAGFNVYAGHHRLNRRLIPVHRSRDYIFRARWTGKGPYSVHVLLSAGGQVVVRA